VPPRPARTTRWPACGLACMGAGQAWLAQVSPSATYWTVLLPGLLFTSLGIGLALPTASIAITNGVSRRGHWLAWALVTTSQPTGAAVGLAVPATVAAARTVQAHGSFVAGYRLAFVIATLIVVAAGVVVAVLMHPRCRPGMRRCTRSRLPDRSRRNLAEC
jgi:MFS family permease